MAEESWADTIEKRHQRRRRGPLDQDAAPDDPAGKAEFLERNNAGCLGQRLKGQDTMLISRITCSWPNDA